jgi:hypothetical protein
MSEEKEAGIKWWMRYVIVPILGGGGIIALIVALIGRPVDHSPVVDHGPVVDTKVPSVDTKVPSSDSGKQSDGKPSDGKFVPNDKISFINRTLRPKYVEFMAYSGDIKVSGRGEMIVPTGKESGYRAARRGELVEFEWAVDPYEGPLYFVTRPRSGGATAIPVDTKGFIRIRLYESANYTLDVPTGTLTKFWIDVEPERIGSSYVPP